MFESPCFCYGRYSSWHLGQNLVTALNQTVMSRSPYRLGLAALQWLVVMLSVFEDCENDILVQPRCN